MGPSSAILKVVVDTNVFISAFIKLQSIPALIFSLISEGKITLILSDQIIEEYEEVFSRPRFKDLDHLSIKKFLQDNKKKTMRVKTSLAVKAIKVDPEDNKFLECALAGKADYLINGNIKHFPFQKFHYTRIITPRSFIDIIGETFNLT